MNYSLYPTRLGVRQGACPRNGRVSRSREWHEGAVLIFGYDIELRNRFLKIGQEYGTKPAEAIAGLHRHNVVVNDGINRPDVGINVGINFTPPEEVAIKAILQNPRITASKLGDVLGMTSRQAERIIASLKKKSGLKRRGARKNGEWYFA